MVLGTIIAILFSIVAYRMARRTGRSAVIWIVMVWVLGTVLSFLFGIAGFFVDTIAASNEDIDSGNVKPYLSFWASAAGTLSGSATAVLLAGRRLPTVSEPPPTSK